MLNYTRHGVIALLLVAVSTFTLPTTAANIAGTQQSGPILTINPSSVVIKVGDSANVSLTLSNSSFGFGIVCFGVEDFPSSGFVSTFVPSCVNAQSSSPAILTVEATPAAAPQSFTAYVVATSGNWISRVPIDITVEPAMSAWIPWSIILVFILILLIPVIIKRRPKH